MRSHHASYYLSEAQSEALDEDALPVLDVLVDPLNGMRAQFQHYVKNEASQVFDPMISVFLYLYKATSTHFFHEDTSTRSGLPGDWQEYLMQQWTRSKEEMEAFLPEVFIGRLIYAVIVCHPKMTTWIPYLRSSSKVVNGVECASCSYHVDQEEAEVGAATRASALDIVADNVASAAPMLPGAIRMKLILAYLLLLPRASEAPFIDAVAQAAMRKMRK
uniref:Uncharacterized protein n=1 Tax=Peronospora matthiolae TaxID=2874970 RepID=A0AAV1TVU6_9STRA